MANRYFKNEIKEWDWVDIAITNQDLTKYTGNDLNEWFNIDDYLRERLKEYQEVSYEEAFLSLI